MRSFGFRLTLLVAILCAGIGSTARALGLRGDTIETVYVMPTSVNLPIATSYVVSTGWIEPTAYAVPTYYTTAWWADPVVLAQPTYATTTYVRRGLLGRRWLVERPMLATYATAYVPTAYYATPRYRATSYTVVDPMVVPTRYLASTDCVCPPVVAMAAPVGRAPARSASPGSATPRNDSASRNVESEPENLTTINSDVGPAPADNRAAGAPGETTARQTIPGALPPEVGGGVRDTTPPVPSAPRPQPPVNRTDASTTAGQTGAPGAGTQGGQQPVRSAPGTGAGGNTGTGTNTGAGANPGAGGNTGVTPAAPVAPAGSDPITPPDLPLSGEVRRNSLRPTYASSTVRPELRNVLVGTVLTSTAREPEEGVRITVRNADSGRERATTTNAFGRFAVRLTDGDWKVDVTMPSGNVYEVSQIRVSNGMITDSLGRRVPFLEITR
jgi:Carboxypeptidase regulatory-like domain